MSDENRNDAGQFVAEAEPLYGIEGVEAEQGFSKMPDPKAEEDWSFDDGDREAAEIYAAISEPADPQIEIFYQNADGSKMDPSLTITPERGAEDLTAFNDANADSAAKSISKDFAAEIDKLRADRLQNDPALEEHYGLKTPKVDGPKPAVEGAEAHEPDAFDEMPGLDEPTKALLRNPLTREALEQNEQRTAAVAEAYNSALNNANSFAQAAFLENFPELAALPSEHLHAGLNHLAQTNPQRFNQAMGVLNRVSQIQNAQQRVQAQNAQRARQEFDSFTAAQDQKFHEMVGNDRAKIAAVADEIVDYAAEMGVSKNALIDLMQTQPIMRHAAFQKMMYDAAQFRMMKNAPRPRPAREVPPVQRPGISRPAGEAAHDDISKLKSELTRTGSIKIAERLMNARAKSRR